MAMARAASLPPGGGMRLEVVSNPFWSETARSEAELRARRPVDLPVPHDEEMDGHRRSRGRSSRSPPAIEVRPMEGGTSRGGMERIFRTPASWGSAGEPLRTAGPMDDEDEKKDGEAYVKTQGPAPMDSRDEGAPELEQDRLQRALEKEVVQELHKENLRLKKELQEVKDRMSTTSWSEVASSVEAPKPPMGTPPRAEVKMEDGWEVIYTPNGTRVPERPPPPPEIPPWPFHYYENAGGERASMKWLGPVDDREVRSVKLRDTECQGGMESRSLHHDLHGGGMEPRHLRHDLCGGGMDSRQPRLDQGTGPMTAVEARDRLVGAGTGSYETDHGQRCRIGQEVAV